jgi:glutamate-ammonia-ligase adenylyltransferase
MALNNWEQFVHAAGAEPAARHFSELVSQPKRLEILLAIFAGSQFLSNTLIRNPEFFGWATSPESVWQRRDVEDYRQTLSELRREHPDKQEWLNALRRFRKQEILRIGTRDICLNVAIVDVMTELSALASEIIRQAADAVFDRLDLEDEARERICILAFGKLGARELNYSSDVDLMGVYRPGEAGREEDLRRFAAVMKHLRSDLSDHMEEGYVYRVDLRLRPHGNASPIAQTADSVISYYGASAAPWEQQALLRLRPVAGSRELGEELLRRLREPFFATWQSTDVRREIRTLRETAVEHHTGPNAAVGAAQSSVNLPTVAGADIKNGIGGLRDIEFLVQGLQILHSRGYPELLIGNTLDAVTILEERSIIPEDTADFLTRSYAFLRRVEHFLQMLEDRQVHRLPADTEGFHALARRVEQAEGLDQPFPAFLEERMTEIRRLFDYYISPPQ